MASTYECLEDIFLEMIDMIRPPETMPVSEAAGRYRYVYSPGSYCGAWLNATTPYMVEPMDMFPSREHKGLIFVGPAQSGKALDIETPIATPDGWQTMGSLRVGDTVFSKTGEPSKVSFATEIMFNHECFRVCFDDGSHLDADADHKWEVVDCHRKGVRVIDTREMFDTHVYGKKSRSRYSIPMTEPILCDEKQLPIDPYVLGVWLGDGHSCSATIHIHEDDVFIAEKIARIGHDVVPESVEGAKSTILKVDPSEGNYRREGSLRHKLGDLGLLDNKHIPKEYLRASISQRLELLRGLNDTDAHVDKRGVLEFCSSIPRLANDYLELCATLGIKARHKTRSAGYKDKDGDFIKCKDSMRITYVPRQSMNPLSLPRKAMMVKGDNDGRPSYTGRRTIVSVVPVDSRPVRCIQIDHESHVFLAGREMIPTHNTDALIINSTAYCVICDPMDMMIFCPTQSASRDFSFRRIERLHLYSKEVGNKLLEDKDADNTFDKHYKTGMILTMSHPSVTEMAGRPIGRVVLTDYDRMPDDVGGDGNPYDLASQRTNTFGALAMTMAESSPSKPVLDPRWIPKTDHEAPPCGGIIELYNRGDRRRWYWPCPHCNQMFEGEFKYLVWDEEDKEGNPLNNLQRAETVRMACPKCGALIHPDERYEMNLWGEWLPDGMYFDKNGCKKGKQPYNMTASYWLKGVAAAFTNWKKLVVEYLDAEDAYERTGSEESLKKFFNNNLGMPYVGKSSMTLRTPEMIQCNAEAIPKHTVPRGVRFIEAAVDVQGNRFVVNVWGILPGRPFDMFIIDRFELFLSYRKNSEGDRMPIDPAAYPEDWDVLIDEVITKQYPLEGGEGFMPVKLTLCDSGGKAGVTSNAYEFYRRLKMLNLQARFVLVKGSSNRNAPRVHLSYPESQRKDRHSGARGDVPVLMLNPNELKNNLDGRLSCTIPGSGMVRFPDWLPDDFYKELCAETRGDKGWENKSGLRNEAWDLACYVIAGAFSSYLSIERIDWDNPPLWAADWDKNNMISHTKETPRFVEKPKRKYDLSQLGQMMR